jgi:hypothetical protein
MEGWSGGCPKTVEGQELVDGHQEQDIVEKNRCVAVSGTRPWILREYVCVSG